MNAPRVVALVCATALFLTGCAIKRDALSSSELSDFSATINAEMRAREAGSSRTIDLVEAIARAIRYNQNIRVEEFTVELANAQSRAQSADMLPSIVADSQFYSRSIPAMARSNLSSTYSTSSDRSGTTASAAFGWSVIDFGLSYVRAQQAGDKSLYQIEQRRKVVQRVVEETRIAYWRAVVYERLVARLNEVDPQIRQIEELSGAQAADNSLDPLLAFQYQRDMLTLRRELELLRASLVGATDQLRQLINFPHDAKLRLKADAPASSDDLIKLNPNAAIHLALTNRYEVRQLMYEMRIDEKEITAALLRLLPGVNLAPSLLGDTSSYLLHSTWTSLGVQASWNLINLFKYPSTYRAIQAKMELSHEKAVALATAVAAQVHIGRARYFQSITAAQAAAKFLGVQKSITSQMRAAANAGRQSEQALAREKLADILAQARRDLAYADVASAYATFISTLGVDPLDYGQLQSATVEEIMVYLKQSEGERKAMLAAAVPSHRRIKGQ